MSGRLAIIGSPAKGGLAINQHHCTLQKQGSTELTDPD
jgi:hypothetical protein